MHRRRALRSPWEVLTGLPVTPLVHHDGMTTARRTTTAQPGARAGRHLAEAPEQLTLLAPTEAPLQFRLDERTRRRGLAQIALIRQQLAEQAERRHADEVGVGVSRRTVRAA